MMRKLKYTQQDQWESEARETQSPILIETAKLKAKKNQIVDGLKNYTATELHKNYNSLSLTANGKMEADQRSFQLEEVHFHHPAEHCFKGEATPRVLEAHFVHYGRLRQPLVVSVTFKLGSKNATFEKILTAMDDNKVEQFILLDDLIPKRGYFYHYIGSLTTPPLTEGVEWVVFEQAQMIDIDQLNHYMATFKEQNNREMQKLNHRKIEKYEI
ncbi:carbonic anhydrase family protein [Pediococcus pentosaceus]